MKLPTYIVGIHGVPRSGTSWLGQLFNSSPYVAYRFQPLFSYAFKDRLDENSSLEEIDKFFEDILNTTDDFVLQRGEKKISKTCPEFHKGNKITHLFYKEVRYHNILRNLLEKKSGIKIVGIVRHPCAVINSWLRAPREFRKEWDPLNEWRNAPEKNQNRKEEFNGFEKWKEVAEIFMNLKGTFTDQFYLLKYSELNNDPLNTTQKLFEFCNLILEDQTVRFIVESTQVDDEDPYGIYRKKRNDDKWQQELAPVIRDAIIKEINNTDYEQFLT